MGIGISGLEGLQATLASDYAIAQVWITCSTQMYTPPVALVPLSHQTTFCPWSMELSATDECYFVLIL